MCLTENWYHFEYLQIQAWLFDQNIFQTFGSRLQTVKVWIFEAYLFNIMPKKKNSRARIKYFMLTIFKQIVQKITKKNALQIPFQWICVFSAN